MSSNRQLKVFAFFILPRCMSLNMNTTDRLSINILLVRQILMRAVLNIHAGRNWLANRMFPTPDLHYR